jgi:hypothetical protein
MLDQYAEDAALVRVEDDPIPQAGGSVVENNHPLDEVHVQGAVTESGP